MRVAFFLKEALRALRRSAAPSLAATLTILLTAVVLGVLIPIIQTTTGTANEVRSRVVLDVYVKGGAQPGELAELRNTLTGLANVADVEFISKERALLEEQERNPEAYELLGNNPLPDSFRITPEDPDGVTALVEEIKPATEGTPGVAGAAGEPAARAADGAAPRPEDDEAADTATAGPLSLVEEVRNREEETDKILSATGVVKLITAIVAVLLVLASVALVANTIRLSIFSRRREIEVMRLVGASKWFIRWPFVIEGMIVGLIGGAGAIALLYMAKISVVDPLSDRLALLAAPETINFGLLVALLIAACAAVAAVGSGVTLRRFLRV
jgi:cell division transport system permease protein